MSRRSIGRYLKRLLHEISYEYRAASRTQNAKDQSAGKNSARPFFVETVNEKWHPQEEKHRQKENSYWDSYLILNAVIAIFTGASAVFAYGAFRAASDQAYEAKRQAVAAEKQIPRPYISATRITHTGKDSINQGGKRVEIDIKWNINNFGTAPAIVEKTITHVFVAYKDPDPLGVVGFKKREQIRDLIQFQNSRYGNYVEISKRYDRTENASPSTPNYVTPQFIVGASESAGEGTGRFIFYNMLSVNDNFGKEDAFPHVWFLCVIFYRDINGPERVTSSYVNPDGLSVEHEQYNCWDEACTWLNDAAIKELER